MKVIKTHADLTCFAREAPGTVIVTCGGDGCGNEGTWRTSALPPHLKKP
jgi:hypothetical protein